MNFYDDTLYKEVIICYNYETRNPTVYGNAIRSEMEFAESSKELQSD